LNVESVRSEVRTSIYCNNTNAIP